MSKAYNACVLHIALAFFLIAQTDVSESNITDKSVVLTLTCGLESPDEIQYELMKNDEDPILISLPCDESTKLVNDLSPNSHYVLRQQFGDKKCVAQEFSKL